MAIINQLVTPYVRYNEFMNRPLKEKGLPFQHFGHQWKHYHKPSRSIVFQTAVSKYIDNILSTAMQIVNDLGEPARYEVTDAYTAQPEYIIPKNKYGREHFCLYRYHGTVPIRSISSVDMCLGTDGRIVLLDRYGRTWWIMLLGKALHNIVTSPFKKFEPLRQVIGPEFTWLIPAMFVKTDGTILRTVEVPSPADPEYEDDDTETVTTAIEEPDDALEELLNGTTGAHHTVVNEYRIRGDDYDDYEETKEDY